MLANCLRHYSDSISSSRLRGIARVGIITALTVTMIGCGGSSSDSHADDGLQSGAASCGTSDAPLRIMPVGDSITEGRPGRWSYRRELWKTLLDAGCNIDFVGSRHGVSDGKRDGRQVSPANADFDLDHESYWGYRADQIQKFIRERAAHYRPAIALIHLGTNDLFQGASPETAFASLEAVVRELKAGHPAVRIFVAKIIPNNSSDADVNTFNRLVGSLINRTEGYVEVVDMNSGFPLSETYDGVHPNENGDKRIALRWAEAILSSLE